MQIGYTTDPARADGASIDNPVSIENESLMITKDFNLTNVDFYVEYMVTDPVQAVRHRSVYESIIKNLAQSYIRDTVGVYNVDDVITTGATISACAKALLDGGAVSVDGVCVAATELMPKSHGAAGTPKESK